MTDLVAIQISSTPSIEQNLILVERQLAALPEKPQLVVLPECFACFGSRDKAQTEIAEKLDHGPIQSALSALAKRYNKWIVAGTVPIKPADAKAGESDSQKFFAASLVYNNDGVRVSRYDKIHLFDVSVGQIICYDVRFPELIQQMPQLDVLVVPSAFTRRTGEAHWHALLQARSIENQCYVVASDQTGVHNNGRETYGNSCIYSPWGELLGNLPTNEGWVAAKYDNVLLANIRKEMPIHQHKNNRKPF